MGWVATLTPATTTAQDLKENILSIKCTNINRTQLTCIQYRTQKTTTTVLQPFVQDYPGEAVPEETLNHPPS